MTKDRLKKIRDADKEVSKRKGNPKERGSRLLRRHLNQRVRKLAVGFSVECGQTMTEYAVALVVITATSVALFTGLSDSVANAANSVGRLFP